MPHTDYNYSLNHYNTMALACTAKKVITLTEVSELAQLPFSKYYFILSGGSNVILPETLNATVLLPRFSGIHTVEESAEHIVIDVMAGENWHALVSHCTQKGWYGLENLALIPGLVGAAPIQNIGAYGAQLEDVLLGVVVYRLSTGKWYYIDKNRCQLGYRDSIFKRTHSTLIVSVRLKLHKNPKNVNLSYQGIAEAAQAFADQDDGVITPMHVMQAVIDIRQKKLPDPKELPNCGSFFQNPIVDTQTHQALKARFGNFPHYPLNDQQVKIPAGWLIDQVGLKGGGVAPILTHKNQALVLTNHAPGLATQKHIKTSQDFIIKMVADTFGIQLLREPVWVNEDGSAISLSQT